MIVQIWLILDTDLPHVVLLDVLVLVSLHANSSMQIPILQLLNKISYLSLKTENMKELRDFKYQRKDSITSQLLVQGVGGGYATWNKVVMDT